MKNSNFYSSFFQAAQVDPTRPCLHLTQDGLWTYSRLLDRIQRTAAVLRQLDIDRGQRLLVQVDKTPENLVLYLACLQVGAVYVPINTAYTADEVAYFLQDAQPELFVHRPEDSERLASVCSQVTTLTLDAGGGHGTLTYAVDAAAPDDLICHREDDDLAAIVYTSGTTGRSKGAMLTHANLSTNAVSLRDYWGWQADDVLLHALPLFHVHGLFIALHCALLSASEIYFLDRFDPGKVLQAMPACSVMMGVPTFYTRLLDHPGLTRSVTDHIRVFISGSAPLTEQTFTAWEERTGHRILERYGMSETIINTSNPLQGERMPGTVGFPLPGVEVRIADEAGEVLASGEVGGIEVRGPNVFKGYWRMPEKTLEEFRSDGFFITGDLGTIDEHGRVSIVGRAKDLVISGGYNVYPKEVEKLIDEIPGVSESAVIGLPHADFGEAVVAVVVPTGDPLSLQTIRDGLKEKLASFKQPKWVINVDVLPRNTMGKVQKNELRQIYNDLFSGQ
ncbi:MAG: malonyl-CoA synthase [Proteobacteria bacterium]|nr:malonyl-CoA synthase [Pseudomonadota bacterium]